MSLFPNSFGILPFFPSTGSSFLNFTADSVPNGPKGVGLGGLLLFVPLCGTKKKGERKFSK
jgi:hypothetical protein